MTTQTASQSTKSFVRFSVPTDYLTTIQTRQATLQIELAKLSAIEAMIRQYAEVPGIQAGGGDPQAADSLSVDTTNTTRRRVGRPAKTVSPNLLSDSDFAVTRSQSSDIKRIRPETVVLEGLAAFGQQGATLADIKQWVQQNYPGQVYAPHILRIALNRAWGSRKAAASEVVGKGVDPIYYSPSDRPPNSLMALAKSQNVNMAA